MNAMDVNMLLSLIILFTACIAPSRADNYVPLQNYVTCADKLFEIKKDTACTQLQPIKSCVEGLVSDSGLRPDESQPYCHDEKPYPYCSMLSGSMGAPMVGSEHPTICSTYVKIKACDENECGPGGNKFISPYDSYGESSSSNRQHDEPSCPKLAVDECILPVRSVTEVNKDTCISVAEAKSCFNGKLDDCGGRDEEQKAVDIILAGLVQHVYQCQEKEYGFTRDGDMCVPNPMDAFIPKDIRDNLSMDPFVDTRDREKALKEFMKNNCPLVESVGTQLALYLTQCNVTQHNSYTVSKVIEQLNGPRLKCMKAGYNLPPTSDCNCDCPRGFGVKGQACVTLTLFAVVLTSVMSRVISRF